MLEKCVTLYPSREASLWAYSLMVPAHPAIGKFDLALSAAEEVLAPDPEDLCTAQLSLKAADSSKDA